jgi:hypothetical protein
MKIIRALSLAFAFVFVPVAAAATPSIDCCPGDCCPNCPHCPNHMAHH